MSEVAPPTLEDLQAQLAAAKAALAASTAPKTPSKFVTELQKIGASILAAFTSPNVVKVEKSVAGLVITRLVITVGASAGFVSLVGAILHAFGINLGTPTAP